MPADSALTFVGGFMAMSLIFSLVGVVCSLVIWIAADFADDSKRSAVGRRSFSFSAEVAIGSVLIVVPLSSWQTTLGLFTAAAAAVLAIAVAACGLVVAARVWRAASSWSASRGKVPLRRRSARRIAWSSLRIVSVLLPEDGREEWLTWACSR
jgi:hypothetical protein